MNRKISITDIHKAIKGRLEESSPYHVYDVVPSDVLAPFLQIHLAGTKSADTKTMYVEEWIFWIHAFAEGESSKAIYTMIQDVREAMTEDILLPCEFELVEQTDNGVIQMLNESRTGEKHAVMEYVFKVCYAYKSKL